MDIAEIQARWDMLGDISIDDNECIEQPFLHFPVGTDRYEIWHWFDKQCPNNLHDDLMFSKSIETGKVYYAFGELVPRTFIDGLLVEGVPEAVITTEYLETLLEYEQRDKG